MIYCSSRAKAVDSALEFYHIRLSENIVLSPLLIDSIKKISNYIHPEYYLAMFLMKRIAYHHGQLPQAIRNIVEELFRKGDIDFIFVHLLWLKALICQLGIYLSIVMIKLD